MRADRLLTILLLLQNRGKITSRELAGQLEVSERTVFRDMEALSAAGIPVYAERGSNGGWVLPESYRTNLTGMKSEEIVSLFFSGQSDLLGDLGIKKHFDAAVQKLLAASPAPIRQNAEAVRKKLHIDGAGWHQSGESIPHLSAVQEAVWEERKLFILYRREDGTVERVVHPLGLVAKRNIWYLIAEADGNLRTYRVSRLLDARIMEESFDPPADFDLAEYWERSTTQFKSNLPKYPATIKMRAALLPRFAQERYVRVLATNAVEDGWIEADVEFETLESASEIVLAFGPQIVVAAPEELRTKVIAEAEAILCMYGS